MHDNSAPREAMLTGPSNDIDSDIEALKRRIRSFENVLIDLYIEGIEAYDEPYSEELFEEWRQVAKQPTGTASEHIDPALRVKVLDAIYTYSKSVAAINAEEF